MPPRLRALRVLAARNQRAAWLPAAMLGILLLGFALRTYRLGADSLWWDETYSLYIARRGLAAINHDLWFDQVPLYYYILSLWIRLAGWTEFAARYISLAAGMLAIPLLYLLLRQFSQKRTAVIGSALLACSSFFVFYSQEARMHAMASMLGIAGAWSLVRAFRRPSLRRWLVYGACAIAAVYTFYYSALLLAAINFPLLFSKRLARRRWITVNSLVLVVWLPWLVVACQRFSAGIGQRISGLRAPDFATYLFRNVMALGFGTTARVDASAAPTVLLLVLGLTVAWKLARGSAVEAQLLAAYAILPVLEIYAITVPFPVYNPRYVLLVLPAWICLGVLAPSLLKGVPGGVWLASAAVWAVLTAVSLYGYYTNPNSRDNYRQAFEVIRREGLPDEIVVYDAPQQFTVGDYYFHKGPLPTVSLPVIGDRVATEKRLEELSQKYNGFWGVYFGEDTPWVEDWLDQHRMAVSNEWYGVGLRLKHYRLGPQPAGEQLPGGLPVHKDFPPLRLRELSITQSGDGRLETRLIWRLLSPTSADYNISLQLFNRRNIRIAQWDGPPLTGGLPTPRWTATNSYDATVTLRPSERFTPGPDFLKISVYDAHTQHPAGKQETVAVLAQPQEEHEHDVEARSPAGWTLNSVAVGTDGASGLLVVLHGSVQSTPPADYTWFAHLLDGNGKLIGQDDHPPIAQSSTWKPGEAIDEVFRLPNDGSGASIEIGAYDRRGKRVQFQQTGGPPTDHLSVPL